MTIKHTLEECPQGPAILDMKTLLGRVAVALEDIAAQGATVASHEKRLDKHDTNVTDLYNRTTALKDDIAKINERHAREAGAEEVKTESRKFWQQVKIALTPKMLSLAIFAIYLVDRLNIGGKLAKLWKEMNG